MMSKKIKQWLTALSVIICYITFFTALTGCADEADTENLVLSGEYLSLNTKDVNIDGAGESKTIAVSANCQWTVTSSENWLTVSPTSGNGSANVTLSAQTNSSVTTQRSATVTVSTSEGLKRTVHVIQTKNSEQLAFNVDQLNFTAAGETKTLSIQSNTSWKLLGAEDWFKLSVTEGSGNSDITITAIPNNTEYTRQAVLIAQGTSLTARITLKQDGEQRAITPSVTNLTFEAVGGTKAFTLDGTAAWTASSNAEWLTLDLLSGTGTATIHATCADNTAQQTRKAQITITLTSSGATQTIDVLQQSASVPTVSNIQRLEAGRTEATLSARAQSSFDIVEYGFCYSTTSEMPTTADAKVVASDRNTQGNYTATLSNLQSGTSYYVRAYARSVVGTGYSEVIKVTTSGGKPGEDDNPKPTI